MWVFQATKDVLPTTCPCEGADGHGGAGEKNQSARDECGCPELVTLCRRELQERKERDPSRPSWVSETWYKRKEERRGQLVQARGGVVGGWPVQSTHSESRTACPSHTLGNLSRHRHTLPS